MENQHLNRNNVRIQDVPVLRRVSDWLRHRDMQESQIGFRLSASNAGAELDAMLDEWEALIGGGE